MTTEPDCWCGHGCSGRHDFTIDLCPTCVKPAATHDPESFACEPGIGDEPMTPELEDWVRGQRRGPVPDLMAELEASIIQARGVRRGEGEA